MAKAVAVVDLAHTSLFSTLTGQTCSSISLSRRTARMQLGGVETYLISCPEQLRIAHALAALTDILLCCVSLEQFQSSDGTRKFTDLITRHFVLGIKFAVVCVNDPLSQQTFADASEQIRQTFRRVGFAGDNCFILPVSCDAAQNLLSRSSAFDYYSGACVSEILGSVTPPSRSAGSFLFTVAECFARPDSVVCCGRVLRGQVKVGDIVTLTPGLQRCPVLSVGYFGQLVATANAGDMCGLALGNVRLEDVLRGSIVSATEECKEVAAFEGQIIALVDKVSWGYEGTLYTHCARVPVRVERIKHLLDRRSGAVLETLPEAVQRGKAAMVRIVPKKPLAVSMFSKVPHFGRFFITNSKFCEVVGVVKSLTEPELMGN